MKSIYNIKTNTIVESDESTGFTLAKVTDEFNNLVIEEYKTDLRLVKSYFR